jgi:hypothetical protein
VKEVMRSNDLVVLSWAEALLGGAGIPSVVLDMHTSAMEGSISAIARRVMVDDDDFTRARRLIDDATPAGC